MENTAISLSLEIVTAGGEKTDNTEANFSIKLHYITESEKRKLRKMHEGIKERH